MSCATHYHNKNTIDTTLVALAVAYMVDQLEKRQTNHTLKEVDDKMADIDGFAQVVIARLKKLEDYQIEVLGEIREVNGNIENLNAVNKRIDELKNQYESRIVGLEQEKEQLKKENEQHVLDLEAKHQQHVLDLEAKHQQHVLDLEAKDNARIQEIKAENKAQIQEVKEVLMAENKAQIQEVKEALEAKMDKGFGDMTTLLLTLQPRTV